MAVQIVSPYCSDGGSTRVSPLSQAPALPSYPSRTYSGEDLNRIKKRKQNDMASQMQRQWLWVAEDEPEKSKDKQKLKNIRSHVMFDHLSEKRKSTLEGPTSSPTDGTMAFQWRQSPVPTGLSRRDSGLPSPTSMPVNNQGFSSHVDLEFGPLVISDYLTPRSMSTPEPHLAPHQISSSVPCTSKRDGKKLKLGTEDSKRRHTESDATKVVKFVDHTEQSIFWLSYTSMDSFRWLGGNKTCFNTLPQMKNPKVSVAELKAQCTRYFGTVGLRTTWTTSLVQDKSAFLSSLCIAASHSDAMNGYRNDIDSHELTAVKGEVIHLVRSSIRKDGAADEILIAIVQMATADLISGHEQALEQHEKGIGALVRLRGGLNRLGMKGQLAAILTTISLLSAVLRETRPSELYLDYVSRTLNGHLPSYPPSAKIPESPLFCPRGTYYTIAPSFQGTGRCSQNLFELLGNMRELTTIASQSANYRRKSRPDPLTLHNRIAEIYQSTLSLPSAKESWSNVHGDWTYEACRIVALIYSRGIWKRIPFSDVAKMYRRSSTFAFYSDRPYTYNAETQSLPAQLKAALLKSDLSDCWGDMAGVLFWVALIGAAAAKEEKERKWLRAIAARCTVVLAFEHGAAVMRMLRELLRITEGLEPREMAFTFPNYGALT